MRVPVAVVLVIGACASTPASEEPTDVSTTVVCEVATDDAPGTATAMEGPIESSSTAADEFPECLYDLAYGPCRKICQGYEIDGVDCPSFGGANRFYSVCAFECVSVDDCPPTPDGRPAICDQGGCFVDCTDGDCPEGSRCVQFGDAEPSAPWVCMYGSG